MNICKKCGSNTTNVKFCSRSCANSHNNSIVPRRKPEHKCKVCQAPINARRKYCSIKCKVAARPKERQWSYEPCECGGTKQSKSSVCQTCKVVLYENLTLGELRSKSVRHAQVYNALRRRSRKIAVSEMELRCLVCGWDSHVQVCHLNALSKLSDETTVKEASNSSNFVLLCPNHHWELDHGLLTLAPRLGVEPS